MTSHYSQRHQSLVEMLVLFLEVCTQSQQNHRGRCFWDYAYLIQGQEEPWPVSLAYRVEFGGTKLTARFAWSQDKQQEQQG
ncbi:hypothetical protein PoB_007543800 [Plakobranchus ocellatus]|uniref:Uncharacterized protein n=1 Tax=Plakobranchus ocellatus TaxID=259542 RepID=A0AAV4DXF1_9GAST|nr:hypothetical protein PoB_007543800 [Plakobranchus ocellatus]